jgi:hypothetical protein
MMLGWFLNERRRKLNPSRQELRMKIPQVKNAGSNSRQANKKEPRKMLPISNAHGEPAWVNSKSPRSKPEQNQKTIPRVHDIFWVRGFGFSWGFGLGDLGFPR